MASTINLQLGWPTPCLFPAKQLATATTASLLNPETVKDALIYGPDLGYTPLRKSLAKWLSSFYLPTAGDIPFERMLVTGGASQNLASVLQVFSDPQITKRVFMVEPTYFLACKIFEDAGLGAKLRGVPENNHGIDLDFLRAALEKFDGEEEQNGSYAEVKASGQYQKIYKHLLYITPTFSNPSAKTISTPVREELLALAREHDILIISDDIYDWLRWPADEQKSSTDATLAQIPPRIVDLDRASCAEDSWGNSISNGFFSKIVAPGVRVGWAEASSKMILRLSQNGATQSGGAPSHLTSTFVHHLLDTGALQDHIDQTLIPTYQLRYRVLMKTIKTYLEPLGVRITTGVPYITPKEGEILPAGGFFTYVSFPDSFPNAAIIAKKAREEYSLIFAYGDMFVVKGDPSSAERSAEGFGRGARLCWAWHEEDEIEEGIKRLARVLESFSS